MRLPTKDEINIYNSLDEITAYEHFYNKTLKEAEALFRENSLTYGQDLMWMGPRAFNFYLQAAITYLQSDYSVCDSDIINCLYSVVEYRWEEKEFSLAIDRVNTMIDYVIDNYDKFEVDSTIYGDLLAAYRQLQIQLKDRT
jgi:hypothetical protein